MIPTELVILLALIAGIVWFWYDSQRAWETVIRHCQSACRELNLQFLDQTVSLSALGLARNADGRLQFLRQYRFEFSTTGADRRQGRAVLVGRRMESIHLDHPEGSTLLTPDRPGIHRLN